MATDAFKKTELELASKKEGCDGGDQNSDDEFTSNPLSTMPTGLVMSVRDLKSIDVESSSGGSDVDDPNSGDIDDPNSGNVDDNPAEPAKKSKCTCIARMPTPYADRNSPNRFAAQVLFLVNVSLLIIVLIFVGCITGLKKTALTVISPSTSLLGAFGELTIDQYKEIATFRTKFEGILPPKNCHGTWGLQSTSAECFR